MKSIIVKIEKYVIVLRHDVISLLNEALTLKVNDCRIHNSV